MRNVKIALAGVLGASAITFAAVAAGPLAGATTTLKNCAGVTYKTTGKLTIGTDNPVYDPWFKNNTPSNGQGYESGVAYAIAAKLGFAKKNVTWTTVPFDSSYTPGTKSFDFDINEISVTTARAAAVDFSNSYYDVQQSIVVLKSSKYAKTTKLSVLKDAKFGDQIGTTGMEYITNYIHPTKTVAQFNTLDLAVAALQSKQIDAIVVDTPTGNYMANWQITDAKGKSIAKQIGQFPSVGEHYGLLFQKGSNLVACVNSAIDALKADGTLKALSKKYLGSYTSVPLIK